MPNYFTQLSGFDSLGADLQRTSHNAAQRIIGGQAIEKAAVTAPVRQNMNRHNGLGGTPFAAAPSILRNMEGSERVKRANRADDAFLAVLSSYMHKGNADIAKHSAGVGMAESVFGANASIIRTQEDVAGVLFNLLA